MMGLARDGGALARNLVLVAQSVMQHALDDPALLSVQVTRRLPLRVRVAVGDWIERCARRRKPDLAALGAFMAGQSDRAEQLAQRLHENGRVTHLSGEVAILTGRLDLIDESAPPRTRARSAWFRGDLTGAVRILEQSGLAASTSARRLRSELDLLSPGHQLSVSSFMPSTGAEGSGGEGTHDAPLRVLHLITNSLPHTQSGYSLRTHRLLLALRDIGITSEALTRTGYPVMIGRPVAGRVDLVDGMTYRRSLPVWLATTPEGRLEQQVDAALSIAEEFRPHIIHATTDYRNALVAQAVSRRTGLPWVLEVRGLMEKTWIASHTTEKAREAATRSEKARRVADREAELARSADAVVTLSSSMAQELSDRGVVPESITLVPNGVDAHLLELHRSPADARRDLGRIPSTAFAVGAVSAVVDYEGFDVLLHAAAEIIHGSDVSADLRRNLLVVIAGDGAAAPGLAQLASDLKIAEHVMMPGRVAREDAATWVQSLDAVTVPRKDLDVSRRVTPQKPVEAMALGRPVIISDLPALQETVTGEDGTVCGIVVPPDDPSALAAAIIRIHDDPDSSRDLVERGRHVAAQRTWPQLVARYEDIYAHARSQRNGGRADESGH